MQSRIIVSSFLLVQFQNVLNYTVVFEIQRDAGLDLPGFLVLLSALVPGLAVMALVALVACTAPTLRALRIAPTEALRS